MIKRPSNSAAAQCHALTVDSSIPTMALTARFSLLGIQIINHNYHKVQK